MISTQKKDSPKSRDPLSEDARAARAMGLTYGKYKALMYTPTACPQKEEKPPKAPQNQKKKKYSDQQLFDLWQQGKTDAEIAASVGVSRAMITKWRDIMDIPSSHKDREKYRLIDTEYGLYAVLEDDLI